MNFQELNLKGIHPHFLCRGMILPHSEMKEKKPKILIVDDTKNIQSLLNRILKKENYLTEIAEDGESGLRKVAEWLPDLILLDVMMPKMDGLEMCRRLKANHKYNYIYVIMLTAKSDADDEITGLNTGADDYMTKPFNRDILMARIRRGLSLSDEKKNATFDPLTSLYNRRIFNDFLQQEIAKFRRYQHPLSLIMIDLDHFKQVNDNFGHQAGDMVLQKIAKILKHETREADMPTRWGGEEMAILLPETDLKGAKILAEKLRQKIGGYPFQNVGHITASFGVATMTNCQTDLLSAADTALYEAKQKGRNKVILFSDSSQGKRI